METSLDPVRKAAYEEVQELIAKGFSGNDVDPKSERSLLAIAVCSGNPMIVEFLIETGADPNLQQSGQIPLIWAASQKYEEIVSLLLSASADVNAIETDGTTALMNAASGGYLRIVQILLENGANPSVEDFDGDKAIVYAARRGHRDIVELLRPDATQSDMKKVDKSLYINRRKKLDSDERKYLDSAKSGDLAGVKTYLMAGHDPDVLDEFGIGALRYAMLDSDLAMLDALIDGGANVNVTDDDDEFPLLWAAKAGQDRLFNYLEPHTKESFHSAAQNIRGELIAEERWPWDRPDIDQRYSDQDISEEEVKQFFHLINMSLLPGNEEKIKERLSENPQLASAIKPDGTTALMRAVSSINVRLVKLLVEAYNVDVNATSKCGHCALREARPQPGKRNPSTRKKIYEYLEEHTNAELRARVQRTIERESKK